MFLFLSFLCLCCCCCCASAWESFPRKCENYSVAAQENLNISQFLGMWYLTGNREETTKCTLVNLKRLNEFEIQVEHLEYSRFHENVSSTNGTISYREPLLMTYLNWTNISLTVVGTDYKDYAVLWLCKNSNESESQQQLWIWSRNFSFSNAAAAAINATVANNNLTHFHVSDKLEGQEQCKLLTEGANVTNGTVSGTLMLPNATANGTLLNHPAPLNSTSNSGINLHVRGLNYSAVFTITTMLFLAAFSQT